MRGVIARGTFIQFRSSMINICPLGRNATMSERKEFEEYDKVQLEREWYPRSIMFVSRW